MPLPAGDAIRRRDQVLARTRRASRWITAVAIAASVGIGGAVAHALPGRHPAAQAATARGPARRSGEQRARPGHWPAAASPFRGRPSSPGPPPPAAAGPAAVTVAEPAVGRVGRLLMTALWYATRGTGVVALLLLTATVVLGIAATARFATPRWPRLMTAGLHRHLSLLVVAFVAVHVATAVLDPFAPIGWAAAVVPFGASYRPLWLGLGAVAFDLLIAVVVTSLLRVRLGYRTWRAVHWLAYASWPVALWHGLGTGTDSRQTPMIGLDAACAAVGGLRRGVADLPAARASAGGWPRARLAWPSRWRPSRSWRPGPLQPGWARRAGTPVRLLTPNAAGPASTGRASSAGRPGWPQQARRRPAGSAR